MTKLTDFDRRSDMKTSTRKNKRAVAAEYALEKYARIKGVGELPSHDLIDETIIDLLTDLRHFSAAIGVDFDEVLRLSEHHFEQERRSPSPDATEQE